MPNWIEHPEPGGVSCTIRNVVVPEVRVQPPPETFVERLGAVDVRDGDDDGLELHVDLPDAGVGGRVGAGFRGAHDCLPRGRGARKFARQQQPVNPRGPAVRLARFGFAASLCVSSVVATLHTPGDRLDAPGANW